MLGAASTLSSSSHRRFAEGWLFRRAPPTDLAGTSMCDSREATASTPSCSPCSHLLPLFLPVTRRDPTGSGEIRRWVPSLPPSEHDHTHNHTAVWQRTSGRRLHRSSPARPMQHPG